MAKRILIYNLITLLTGFILYFSNSFLANTFGAKLNISLIGVYSFFVIATMITIIGLEFLHANIPSSTGYGFLVSVFLKMGIFVIIFMAGGMAKENLSMIDKISILIPLFVFLSIETFAIIKRLKF